jgi:PPP family 3-phenylpropionic acid transporter
VAAGRRIFVAYLVYFGAVGVAYPYLPVFYRDLGLSLQEIGLLTAIQAGTQLLLGPLWGGLVDRFPKTRLTLPMAAVVATGGALDLFVATDFPGVLAGSVLLFAGLAGIGPTLDARTLETLGPSGRDRYGQVRAFGSVGFVVSTLLAGLVLAANGSRSLFWMYIPALVATAVVTATIGRRGSSRSVSLFRGTTEVLSVSGMLLLFGGFTVVWTALTALNAFYSIQIVALGGSNSLVGVAWAFGAAIEVPLMYLFPRLAKRFGTERLLVLGATAMALRAVLAALAVAPLGLVVIAPLEGFAFACVFVGGVTVLSARTPASLGGTVQGLFSASAGLATIIGSVAGGEIAGALGIPGLFALCGALGLIGAAIVGAAVLGPRADRRGVPGEPITASTTPD